MNWALWAVTLSTPHIADELFGVQEQLHDHNLYILDLGNGHFWQTRKAHHILQINCWPANSNYMTTIYIYWILGLDTLADTLSTPNFADNLLGAQEQPQDHNLYILDLGIGQSR